MIMFVFPVNEAIVFLGLSVRTNKTRITSTGLPNSMFWKFYDEWTKYGFPLINDIYLCRVNNWQAIYVNWPYFYASSYKNSRLYK